MSLELSAEEPSGMVGFAEQRKIDHSRYYYFEL